MADANTINYFQAMMNPQFASQQLQIQRQQALAQQLMDEGSKPLDNNQLANPNGWGGGFVVPVSPLAVAGKALERTAGSYVQGKALADQMNAYAGLAGQQTPDQSPEGQGGAPLLPWQTNALTRQPQGQAIGNAMMGNGSSMQMTPTELYHDMLARGSGTAEYNHRLAEQMAGAEAKGKSTNTPLINPEGQPYYPNPNPLAALPPSTPVPPTPVVSSDLPSPPDASSIPKSGGIGAPGGAVNLQMPDNKSSIPMAGDNKPLLPNINNIPAPDKGGIPAYDTPVTNSGVDLKKQLQTTDLKSNSELNSGLSSLQGEQFRIQELAKIYKDVQAGTLTAQQPEFFNRMAAIGFKDDPVSIEQLGGIQAAMQNHVLQLVNQYKDTNNAMGETPSRMFGGVINTLIDHGENPGNQPGGLHTVLAEALGAVNHHIDMVNGWNIVGGLGNRLVNGKFTQRPDDFIRDWSLNHKISDYNDIAQKSMPAFKGMAGNNGEAPSIGTISKGHKFLGGDPSQPESWSKLP